MTGKFLGEYRIFTRKAFTMPLKTGKLELAHRLHFIAAGDASRGSL
jgi:hypothetical protein